ncbi:MAG TPA: tetratricopeptide repeat protein [Bacillota bacterium]|nr:tetratricopeptide repeat protein [Bacillota bacterium]HQC35715.1 tetratricopeptide repeat protein [Bacillota bacterium]
MRAKDNCCNSCDVRENTTNAQSIPVERVADKLDALLNRRDFEGALRHLKYWIAEAEALEDPRGRFSLSNELMGLYRKMGMGEEAQDCAASTLALGESLGIMDDIGGATAFVNAATVYDAFGRPEDALPLFEKARTVYEKRLGAESPKLGGLYNNMALALAATGRYREADACFEKAMEIMGRAEHGGLEQAVTCLNMADAAEAELGAEAAEKHVNELLDKAQALLDDPALPREGYYAFMADKCIGSFEYYGYFLYAKELKERVKAIYKDMDEAEDKK